MRKLITILIIIHSVVVAAASGPLRGRLVDFRNRPITSAKIYVHNLKKYVKPDKQGLFRVEDVNPDDTIYVKWRGHFYGIPVEGSKGVYVKFDREPNNSKVVNMGIMGTVHANNYNSPVHRYIPITTAVEIMRQESLKYYNTEEEITKDVELTTETFRGRLFDYRNKPIKNAKVFARGSNRFVKTDKQGKFLLYGVHPTDTVFVSWRGEIYDIPVDGNNGTVIKFSKDWPKRHDFVDTGKGVIDAGMYNGPRDVRTAKQLEATGESDLIQALRGVPGVFVGYDKKSGKSKISIRGFGSPLWIIDGVEMTVFPELTVMEVERVEILKDGSFYGSRGAGGVIVVTTKGSSSNFSNQEKE